MIVATLHVRRGSKILLRMARIILPNVDGVDYYLGTFARGVIVKKISGYILSAALAGAVAYVGGSFIGSEEAVANSPSAGLTFKYNPNFKAAELPLNSELAMLDDNVEAFALQMCGFDGKYGAQRPLDCELFSQANPNSSLTGYLILRRMSENDKPEIISAVETIRANGGMACWFEGRLTSTKFDTSVEAFNPYSDFKARLMWESTIAGTGEYRVAFDEDRLDDLETNDPTSARGAWEIERKGQNLKVARERWSYCYKDTEYPVEAVFRSVLKIEPNE